VNLYPNGREPTRRQAPELLTLAIMAAVGLSVCLTIVDCLPALLGS